MKERRPNPEITTQDIEVRVFSVYKKSEIKIKQGDYLFTEIENIRDSLFNTRENILSLNEDIGNNFDTECNSGICLLNNDVIDEKLNGSKLPENQAYLYGYFDTRRHRYKKEVTTTPPYEYLIQLRKRTSFDDLLLLDINKKSKLNNHKRGDMSQLSLGNWRRGSPANGAERLHYRAEDVFINGINIHAKAEVKLREADRFWLFSKNLFDEGSYFYHLYDEDKNEENLLRAESFFRASILQSEQANKLYEERISNLYDSQSKLNTALTYLEDEQVYRENTWEDEEEWDGDNYGNDSDDDYSESDFLGYHEREPNGSTVPQSLVLENNKPLDAEGKRRKVGEILERLGQKNIPFEVVHGNVAQTDGKKIEIGTYWVEKENNVLAFVLSHESAHINLEHIKQQQEHDQAGVEVIKQSVLENKDIGIFKKVIGTVVGAAALAAMSSSFSREKEMEADALGAAMMEDSGFDYEAAITTLESFGDANHTILGIFDSHPTGSRRADSIREKKQNGQLPREKHS